MSFTPRALIAALASALAIVLITVDANGLAFFLANQMKFTILTQVFDFFLPSYVILLVLTFVAGLLGWFRGRWIALAVGIVASTVAALASMLLQLIGKDVSQVPWAQFFDSLLNLDTVFITVGTVAAVTAAPAIFRRIAAAASASRQVALVRAPAANLADGIVTHISRKKVDVELANDQWDAYVETLNSCGWQTVEVQPSNDLADSVFVEDTVVVLGQTAVITSPGAESREAEIVASEQAARKLGLKIERITKPGTLDGGDVLKIGKTIYVGSGGRTNGEGIRQLRAIASRLGYTVVAVPISKALHLKSAVTALPDGTVIGYAPLVDNTDVFPRFVAVPEAHGAAVVVLGDDLLLLSKAAPKTAALLETLGYNVVTVDISEFEKLEGCVTCLSVRVR